MSRHRSGALQVLVAVGLITRLLTVGSESPATAQATVGPIGAFDLAAPAPGGIRVHGWTYDPDTPTQPTDVHVYLDGAIAAAVRADHVRPDVGMAIPGAGDLHGFATTVAASPGSHHVCVYAINTGPGANTTLSCDQIVVVGGDPVGSLDVLSVAPGSISASGWALDPDTPAPVDIHTYIDGVGVGVSTASVERPDVGAAFPDHGSAHGFTLTVPAAPGARTICFYAINQGPGAANPAIGGCRTVTVPGNVPVGVIEAASPGPSGIWVDGWAVDPDGPVPVTIHVYVDGQFAVADTAGISRPDVGAAFPDLGSDHGFEIFTPAAPGSHEVCAFALNAVGPGGNTLLGCRAAVAWPHTPVGTVDYASFLPGVSGGMFVAGWAIDPDSPNPVDVRVLVDGVLARTGTAGYARADVGAMFPAYGPRHGYVVALPELSSGVHTVCVQVLDNGVGPASSLGCRTVNASRSVFGAVDSVVANGAQWVISGWAIDPDVFDIPILLAATAPDGTILGWANTGIARPDLAAIHPFWPTAGFQITVTWPGWGPPPALCVVADDLPGHTPVPLGCR